MYCLSRISFRNNLKQISKLQNIRYASESVAKSSVETYKPDTTRKKSLKVGPNLKDFLTQSNAGAGTIEDTDVVPYLKDVEEYGQRRKVLFEVYGCQMNVNDTEIIWSILKRNNYLKTDDLNEADIVLLITCAIREGAEQKIWNRLNYLKGIREKKRVVGGFAPMKVGLLGCMAERLKQKVLEIDKSVDIVAGPDSYKDLPRLLSLANENETAINVLLSFDETYADVMPVRLNENSVSAFVSIMRGCDNMCTYCIVPFTRGRERSRPVNSILDEIRHLSEQGVKEVTLLGQNVNSYRDVSDGSKYYMTPSSTNLAKGFKTVYKNKVGGLRFADLLEKAAEVDPEMRIRFTSPHPKDFPDEVLQLINLKPNICKNLHMPAQSGNSNVLERMRRGYTREAYLELIDRAKSFIPSVALSSDFICGFCGETEEEFEDTITLIEKVRYNMAYLFMYSMREKTTAHRRFKDDVPLQVKHKRLERMANLYRELAEENNKAEINQTHLVLVEGSSKRSNLNLQGRTDGNLKVIFPACSICDEDGFNHKEIKPGDYLAIKIYDANSQVLKGVPLYHTSLTRYHRSGK